MKSLIEKIYEPDTYGLIEIATEIQALIDDRDCYKRALIECAIDFGLQENFRNHPDCQTIDDWYEVARKQLEQEKIHSGKVC